MGIEELTAAQCGACGQASTNDAKFCAGCGQSLFEACGGCGKQVLLTQKYCGSCGCNLEEALQKRLEEIGKWLAEAVTSAKSHRYDQSIFLLRRAANPADYRFAELASQAQAAVDKVVALRDRAVSSADALANKAKDAFERDLKVDAARYVQQIPEPLRSESSNRILANSLAALGQETSLISDLRASIKAMNWVVAGNLLQQAMELSPDDPQFRKIGVQVSGKLDKLSEKYFQTCDYSRAAECLQSIPDCFRGEEHESRQIKLDGIVWLSQQFDVEPFATATLGRLAVRFTKEAPHDESAAALVKQLAAQVKQKAETPRDPWAPWKASRQTWCGGRGGFLAYPQTVQFAADSQLRKVPGRFHVAIGLAAQGLGLGRVKENFVESKRLLGGFGRRKNNSVWGIDIASTGIRAVLLTRDAEGVLVIEQDYYRAFDAPTCRVGHAEDADETIRNSLATMSEEVELGDAPVWVNLSCSELITRFVRLPPLGDKQASAMLQVEAEQRIPLPIEELRLINWIAELGEDEVTGRPASVSAARKTVVEKRLELCAEAGLKVSGMQADSLALVNFADVEFAQLWFDPDGADDASEASFEAFKEKVDSVLLLDAGASTTTLVIVSSEAFWFWNLESGGESLTKAIAGNAKTVAAEAEDKKLNPSALEDLGHQFARVEQRQDELRGRLEKMVAEATKENERFNIVQSWCFGGACLTHGWIRRVMLERELIALAPSNSQDLP